MHSILPFLDEFFFRVTKYLWWIKTGRSIHQKYQLINADKTMELENWRLQILMNELIQDTVINGGNNIRLMVDGKL